MSQKIKILNPYQLLLKEIRQWISNYDEKATDDKKTCSELEISAYELLLDIKDTIIEREGEYKS